MEENTKEVNNISSAYLLQKLKTLKKEYNNFTKSTSSKTKKCNNNIFGDDFLELADNDDSSSLRDLMCALQSPTMRRTTRRASLSFSYCSPSTVTGSSGEVWRVRENDLAIEEIRRERRRHAFESGKLRGRRLSFDEDGDSEVSYEDHDDHSVFDDDRNVQVIKEVVEKRKMGDVILCIANGKMIKIMLLIFVVLMVFAFGFIFMGEFSDEHVSEVKDVVFPT